MFAVVVVIKILSIIELRLVFDSVNLQRKKGRVRIGSNFSILSHEKLRR